MSAIFAVTELYNAMFSGYKDLGLQDSTTTTTTTTAATTTTTTTTVNN